METIYCFKLDEDTGKLTRYEINFYSKRNFVRFTGYTYWLVEEDRRRRYDFREENFDKFVNWKLHTYDPSWEHAREIIQQTLTSIYEEAQCKADRFAYALDLFVNYKKEGETNVEDMS